MNTIDAYRRMKQRALNEATLSNSQMTRLTEADEYDLDVTDVRRAVTSLRDAGLKKVTPNVSSGVNAVIVTAKSRSDKRNLVMWMLQNGWEKRDIADLYPDLGKA